MKRAIVIIRTSTVRQEIEAQREEICQYAKGFGYTENEVIVVGDKGASAIKLNDLYKKNMALIRSTIETTPSIDCVFAWSLDRIARKDSLLLEFKNFLIDHKINLRIKNPTLSLFNDDGSVNGGIELAISLFATLSQQEMQIKQERFMRAKKSIAAQGKFIGARYMHFGYKTNDDGYLLVNEDEAEIVRLVYRLYLTGKQTATSIARELNERGYKFRGRKFHEGHITNLLKDTAFVGYLERNSLFKEYPAIITQEQYDAAKKIRNSRNSQVAKTKDIHLAVKILKCWDCGSNYVYCTSRNVSKYACYKRKYKSRLEPDEICHDSCGILTDVMDDILKRIAIQCRELYSTELTNANMQDMKKRKAVLLRKIDTTSYELENIDSKFAKLVDAWTEDIITKEQYEKRIEKLKAEKDSMFISISSFKKELEQIERSLSQNDKSVYELGEIYRQRLSESTEETDLAKLKEAIDRFIKVAYVKEIEVEGYGFTLIMVIDYQNEIYSYLYQQHHGKKQAVYTLSEHTLEPLQPFTKDEVLNGSEEAENNNITDVVKRLNKHPEVIEEIRKKVLAYNDLALAKI